MDMNANDTISVNVDELLRERGEYRQTFGRGVGRSSAWVSQRLNGDRRWTADDLDDLSDYFGLPAAVFLVPRIRDTRQYHGAPGLAPLAA